MRHLENEVKGLTPPSVPALHPGRSALQGAGEACVCMCAPSLTSESDLHEGTSNIDLHDTDAKLTQPMLPKMPGSWKTGATGDPEQGRQAGGGMAHVNCHRSL